MACLSFAAFTINLFPSSPGFRIRVWSILLNFDGLRPISPKLSLREVADSRVVSLRVGRKRRSLLCKIAKASLDGGDALLDQ